MVKDRKPLVVSSLQCCVSQFERMITKQLIVYFCVYNNLIKTNIKLPHKS